MQPERVAVVTGMSSGIGAATARHLSRAGFQVVGGHPPAPRRHRPLVIRPVAQATSYKVARAGES